MSKYRESTIYIDGQPLKMENLPALLKAGSIKVEERYGDICVTDDYISIPAACEAIEQDVIDGEPVTILKGVRITPEGLKLIEELSSTQE